MPAAAAAAVLQLSILLCAQALLGRQGQISCLDLDLGKLNGSCATALPNDRADLMRLLQALRAHWWVGMWQAAPGLVS